ALEKAPLIVRAAEHEDNCRQILFATEFFGLWFGYTQKSMGTKIFASLAKTARGPGVSSVEADQRKKYLIDKLQSEKKNSEKILVNTRHSKLEVLEEIHS